MKWLLILILLIPSVTAICNTTNDFHFNASATEICGYCDQNLTDTPCGLDVNCTLDIRYTNGTKLVNQAEMNNSGDGSYTYNATVLSAGNYIGKMCCDGSNCETFEITVAIPAIVVTGAQGGGGGGGSTIIYMGVNKSLENITNERLVDDINAVWKRAGDFSPSNPIFTQLIFLIALILLVFYKEFGWVLFHIRPKKAT